MLYTGAYLACDWYHSHQTIRRAFTIFCWYEPLCTGVRVYSGGDHSQYSGWLSILGSTTTLQQQETDSQSALIRGFQDYLM